MIDIEVVMVDFVIWQVEWMIEVVEEIQQFKVVIFLCLQEVGIVCVEICFDGCGDSGVVEECVCLDVVGVVIVCFDGILQEGEVDKVDGVGFKEQQFFG